MTRNAIYAFGAILMICGGLGGCASGGGDATIANGGGAAQAKSGLSLGEADAVTLAARTMTGDPAANVHGLRSRAGDSGSGVHVCGYVRTPTQPEALLYVELSEQGGLVKAERGQIGATPQNLAKVRFMCRAHGEW